MKGSHLMYSRAAGKVMELYLHDHYTLSRAKEIRTALKDQYLLFLEDLPELGGRKNSQAQSVYDCIALFAFYEVLPEKISLKAFEDLVSALFVPGFQKICFFDFNWSFSGKIAHRIFSRLSKKSQEHEDQWPGNYHMYTDPYDRTQGVRYRFTTCPIADFARVHGYSHLMPAMCNPDYPTLQKIHAELIRTKTCAYDDCCDYWILGDKSPLLKDHPLYTDSRGFLKNK